MSNGNEFGSGSGRDTNGSPAVVDGVVYIGSGENDDTFYALCTSSEVTSSPSPSATPYSSPLTTASPSPSMPLLDSPLTIVEVLAVAIAVIFAVTLLVYRAHRKKEADGGFN